MFTRAHSGAVREGPSSIMNTDPTGPTLAKCSELSVARSRTLLWSLAVFCLCCLFLASECNKMEKTSLCAFCGSDTFACGSNMEQALQQADNQSWPMLVSPSTPHNTSNPSPQHSLNAKVQRMLLLLNRNMQVFNSSNCTCIPASWRCDRSIDCEDASDEIGCVDSPVVPETNCDPELYQCDNGDESKNNHNSTCKADEYQCGSGNQCIPKAFHCDRQNFDCVDRSDEIGCTPPTIVESPSEFVVATEGETVAIHCRSIGVPVPFISWHQKGKTISSSPRVTSSSVEGTGTLSIREVTFSDQGTYSCEAINSLDSVFAPQDTLLVIKRSHNQADNFTTSEPVSTVAVGEGSHVSCPVSFFMCHNGLCISELYKCDGDFDCADKSDEIDCDESGILTASKCKADEFPCPSNGQCVLKESNCPIQISSLDCKSGSSDRGECINQRNECTSGTFRCRDGSCVSLSVLCDGRPNCPEGSDEDTNSTCVPGVVPCRENGLPCQHLCVATSVSHFCACKEGYRKGSDGHSCLDINECMIGSLSSELDFHLSPMGALAEHVLTNIQVCSQLCSNFVPGFMCSCAPGYRLETDKRRCSAIQGQDALLLAAWTADMLR